MENTITNSSTKTSNKRQSNLELLRIIAMIMIVIYHICMHSNIFSEAFSINKGIAILLGTWGTVGNTLFFSISAYFLIESKKIDIKKLIKLEFQVLFYTIAIFIFVFITKAVNYNIKDLIKTLLPVFFNVYWFITAYFILYLFHCFLNKIIYTMTIKELKIFVIMLSFLVIIYKLIWSSAPIGKLMFVIYIYMLMGLLKRKPNNFFERNAKKGFIIMTITCVGAHMIFCIVLTKLQMVQYMSYINKITSSWYYCYNGIFLFYIFKNMNIKYNKIINNIASITTGVYLLHENFLIGDYIRYKIVRYNTIYFIIDILVYMLLIFVITYIIEIIRKNIFEKLLCKLLKKHEGKIDRINTYFLVEYEKKNNINKNEKICI